MVLFSEIQALGLSSRDDAVCQPGGKLRTDWSGVTLASAHFLGQLLAYLLTVFSIPV